MTMEEFYAGCDLLGEEYDRCIDCYRYSVCRISYEKRVPVHIEHVLMCLLNTLGVITTKYRFDEIPVEEYLTTICDERKEAVEKILEIIADNYLIKETEPCIQIPVV